VDSTFRRLLCFMKPYQGPFVRSGRVIADVRFYDEREWRWVPADQVEQRVLSKEKYFDFAALRDANAWVREQAVLSFEPSDIKFLLVANESEILPMIRQLRLIKAKYSGDEVALLCSRIVSAEQVLRDL
jgi:Putative abortive phage resistance protein AbiGi, antitoxin